MKTFYGVNILKIKCNLHSFHQKGYFHFRKKFLNNCTNILGEHLYSNLFNPIFYIETNANWYYRKFFITLKLFHSLIWGNFFVRSCTKYIKTILKQSRKCFVMLMWWLFYYVWRSEISMTVFSEYWIKIPLLWYLVRSRSKSDSYLSTI